MSTAVTPPLSHITFMKLLPTWVFRNKSEHSRNQSDAAIISLIPDWYMPIVACLHGIICQIISVIGLIMIPATLVVECETAYLTTRAVLGTDSTWSCMLKLATSTISVVFLSVFTVLSVFTLSTTRYFVIVNNSYCTIALWCWGSVSFVNLQTMTWSLGYLKKHINTYVT